MKYFFFYDLIQGKGSNDEHQKYFINKRKNFWQNSFIGISKKWSETKAIEKKEKTNK